MFGRKRARIKALEKAIVYTHFKLAPKGPVPAAGDMAESLNALANERSAWIEVCVSANRAVHEYVVGHGVEDPYGMPIDGVRKAMAIDSATKAPEWSRPMD